MKPSFKILDWDSKHFGHSIASLEKSSLTKDGLREAFHKAETSGVECLYSLIPAQERHLIALAKSHGFEQTDMRITFRKTLHGAFLQPLGLEIAKNEDFPELSELCQSLFQHSRFLNDPRFERSKAQRMYVEWIRKNLESEHPVFVSKTSGKITGFLSTERQGSTGKIGLIAVVPGYQKNGLGQRLVDAACAYLKQIGCDHCDVVTQGDNLAACSLYEKRGFSRHSTEVWLHKWLVTPDKMAA